MLLWSFLSFFTVRSTWICCHASISIALQLLWTPPASFCLRLFLSFPHHNYTQTDWRYIHWPVLFWPGIWLTYCHMRALARNMAANTSGSSRSYAASSSNVAPTSRSGYFIRNRLKRLGSLVGEALVGGPEDEDAPSPYTEERCLVFVGLEHP